MNQFGTNAAMNATGAITTAAVHFHVSRYCSAGICLRPMEVAYTPTMAVPTLARPMKTTAMMPIHSPATLTKAIDGSGSPVARPAYRPMSPMTPVIMPRQIIEGSRACFTLLLMRMMPPM